MPQLKRVDGLHIVMAVEQHTGAAVGAAIEGGDDGRMAGGGPDLGRKAERRDVAGEMLGGRLAISGEGRVGRDRLDTQQLKQPLQAVVEIGINAVEHGRKLRTGHFGYP